MLNAVAAAFILYFGELCNTNTAPIYYWMPA
jgi:hypothetical protein